jgi:steroid Delta-isomerase
MTPLPPARHPEPHVAALILAFEALTPATLDALVERYAEQARFKDPFNDVRGRVAVRRVYAHMFDTLGQPRFTILAACGGGSDCFLTWDLDCTLRGKPLRIHGASRLQLDAQGRITEHRDYWDTAEELFAKLPLLGPLVRALLRRLATPSVGARD